MSRQKLPRFEEIAERYNVVQRETERFKQLKGNWAAQHFKNEFPVNLELACGRGEYTVGLAKLFPEQNYIGVDIKGERLWKGSTEAIEASLDNAAFLRTFALDLQQSFTANEIQNIWLIHPDPRPRDRDEKRRLTHPRFLAIYKYIQQDEGFVHLKTDNTDLFEWTLAEVINKRSDIVNLKYTNDLKQSELFKEHYGITTRYEKKFEAAGEKIKYLRFQWKA